MTKNKGIGLILVPFLIMIEPVISHINTALAELKGFDPIRIKGLAETIIETSLEGEPKEHPGIYQGNDTLKDITTNDFKNGCIWHQKDGTIEAIPGEQVSRRRNILEYSFPMKVFAIHKRSLTGDDSYSADILAAAIINKINFRNINALRSTMNLIKISVQDRGWSTDKSELDQIFKNVDIKNLKAHDIIFCAVSYNIILKGRQECFEFYTCE